MQQNDSVSEVILPLANVHFDVPVYSFGIGPVTIEGDPIHEVLGADKARYELGDFGRWVANEYPEESREDPWFSALSGIGTVARVKDIHAPTVWSIPMTAMREIERALAILRVSYYRHGMFVGQEHYGEAPIMPGVRHQYGVMGTLNGGPQMCLFRSADAEQGWSFVESNLAVDAPVILITKELEKRKPILDTLSGITWGTKYQSWKSLSLATRFLSDGTAAFSGDDAFLKYMIGIDLLMGKEDRIHPDTKTSMISERVAFLFFEEASERRACFQGVRELYTARSAMVHAGKSPESHQIDAAEHLLRILILRLCWEVHEKRMSSPDKMIEQLRSAKFGDKIAIDQVPRYLSLSPKWSSLATGKRNM